MTTHHKFGAGALALAAALCQTSGACPQDAAGASRHHCVDWSKLNLNTSQNERIRHLQADWNGKYRLLMPEIHFQQQHLQDLVGNPHADPLEILSTQQSISRLQEQLRNDAMTNYLHKRAILNDPQQRQLEAQVHELVVERQQRPAYQQANSPDNSGLGNIMQKIRWAIGAH